MSTREQDNKATMRAIFDELARGNGRPFVDAMADDFCWTITGHSAWAGRWQGKQVVREQLLKPLFARFAGPYVNEAQNFVAEGDTVVVQCRGRVATRSGQPYCNEYCYVCRLADGRLLELIEYMDTEHALTALGPP